MGRKGRHGLNNSCALTVVNWRPGRSNYLDQFVVDGAAAFFLVCFFEDLCVLVAGFEAAGADDAGVPAAGVSAAIAEATRPNANSVDVIKVPDLVIGSPAEEKI
jgi:hypothetical protein